MPHKHNDINRGVDPEQIRRYLAGELDDKSMHLLEKQALEDPFLAEALEGFAEHAPDQQLHLADLESRLEKRIAQNKQRKLPVYYRWAAAAAILLLIGVGLTKMWELPNKNEVAKAVVLRDSVSAATITNENGQPVEPKPDLVISDIKKPAILPNTKYTEPVIQDDAPAPAEDNALSSKDEAPAFAKAKKLEITTIDTNADKSYAADVTPAAAAAEKNIQSTQMLNGRMAGVAIRRSAAPSQAPKRMLQGRVTDQNNTPLSAVTVMAGTRNGTVTDQDGKFAIQVDSTKDVQLNINYLGYESKKLKVDERENNLSIAINEDNRALSEVIIVNSGISKKKLQAVNQAPVPAAGFDRYQEYLMKNVVYPPSAGNIKGAVRVAFTVKKNGELTRFKVIRKLQEDCDTEAIRVIKEGPVWTPASNGKSERVEIEVPFIR